MQEDHSTLWFPVIRAAEQACLRLVCFPFAGGSPASFFSLAKTLLPAVEVRCLNLPGRWSRMGEEPKSSIRELIPDLYKAYSSLPAMRTIVFGHSNGALLSYELLCALSEQQLKMVNRWIISAKTAPHIPVQKIRHQMDDDELMAELVKFEGTPARILQNNELMKALLPTIRADFALSETYKVKAELVHANAPKLNMPISLWWARDDELASAQQVQAWRIYCAGPVSEFEYDGGHFYILKSNNEFLTQLNQVLAKLLV